MFKLILLEERIVLDAAAVIAAIQPPPSGTTTIFVDINVDKSSPSYVGDGSSWSNAVDNLQSALDMAANNTTHPGLDQIWVAKGTYLPQPGSERSVNTLGPVSQSRTFTLNSDVYIVGGFSGNGTETLISQADPTLNKTVLSGDLLGNDIAGDHSLNKFDNAWHVMRFTNTSIINVHLDGLTIENGYASASVIGATPDDFNGGALLKHLFDNSTLTLNHVVVQDNVAISDSGLSPLASSPAFGGGVAFRNGTLNINDTVFQNNEALNGTVGRSFMRSRGGGLYFVQNTTTTFVLSHLNILDSTFLDNTARTGGGVHIGGGIAWIGDSEFLNNSAYAERGGALNYWHSGTEGILKLTDDIQIVNSLFQNNFANHFGGALDIENSLVADHPFLVSNCQFIDNTSNTFGGAIAPYNGVMIDNSNFIHNTAAAGGAIDFAGASVSAPVTVQNSHFVGNVATGAPLPLVFTSFSPDASFGGGAILVAEGSTTNIINSDFVNNTAPNGGAISVAGIGEKVRGVLTPFGATLNVSDSRFVNNQAVLTTYTTSQVTGDGGAIISKGWSLDGFPTYGKTITTITNSEFINNRAANDGGAIAVDKSNSSNGLILGSFTLTGSKLNNNNADHAGGAVSLANTTASVTGNTFYQSNESINGDQFWITNSSVNTYTDPTDIINSLKSQIKKYELDDIIVI